MVPAPQVAGELLKLMVDFFRWTWVAVIALVVIGVTAWWFCSEKRLKKFFED